MLWCPYKIQRNGLTRVDARKSMIEIFAGFLGVKHQSFRSLIKTILTTKVVIYCEPIDILSLPDFSSEDHWRNVSVGETM